LPESFLRRLGSLVSGLERKVVGIGGEADGRFVDWFGTGVELGAGHKEKELVGVTLRGSVKNLGSLNRSNLLGTIWQKCYSKV